MVNMWCYVVVCMRYYHVEMKRKCFFLVFKENEEREEGRMGGRRCQLLLVGVCGSFFETKRRYVYLVGVACEALPFLQGHVIVYITLQLGLSKLFFPRVPL